MPHRGPHAINRWLERRVDELRRGRSLRLAAATAAVLASAHLTWFWPIATDKHRAACLAVIGVLAGLAALGRPLEPRAERLARDPRSAWVVLGLWLLASPAVLSPVLAVLLLVLAPFTGLWFMTRGRSVLAGLAIGFSLVMFATGRTTLAALPAIAYLLRVRPGLAFAAVLLLGLVLRASLVLSVPRPLWTPDSFSYVAPAYHLLDGSSGPAPALGRPPLVAALVLLTVRLGGSHFVFVAVAHAIGLLVAWWAGARVRRTFGDLAGWQACAALALSPELVQDEHSLMSEASFVASMTVLAVLLLDLRAGAASRGAALALGLAAGLVAVAKPVAIVVPFATLAVTALARWPLARVATLATGAAMPILLLCSINLASCGSFSPTDPQFRGYVLFSVFGDRVVLDSPLHARVKAEMKDALGRYHARHGPWDLDGNHLVWAADGPLSSSPALRAMTAAERGRVVSDLAVEAILADPGGFALRSAYKAWTYVAAPRHQNDGYAGTWDVMLERDQTRRHFPPGSPLVATPAIVQGLEGERLFRLVFEPLSLLLTHGVGRTAFGKQAFSHYKDPVVALLLLALIWRLPHLRSFRPAALGLLAVWVAIMGATCVFSEPIPRYRLQVYPLGVMLTALALADPRRLGRAREGAR